jgi:hypothetical protein
VRRFIRANKGNGGSLLTVLLTARGDACSDFLMPHFSREVLRLDLDFMHHDGILWNHRGLSIGERLVPWNSISALYWRKPSDPIVAALPQLESFELRQRLHWFRALSAVAKTLGIWQLVDPLHEYNFPKPLQLMLASRYFRVPQWELSVGRGASLPSPIVSKAFAPVPVKGDRLLTTNLVREPSQLDPKFTWFLQSAVGASHDATVVFCRGRMWAFVLERPESADWVDWRLIMSHHLDGAWRSIELPTNVEESILKFMKTIGLSYGRLDFLIDRGPTWWFLEVNPNGQFGWLDPQNSRGIYSAVAAAAECRENEVDA